MRPRFIPLLVAALTSRGAAQPGTFWIEIDSSPEAVRDAVAMGAAQDAERRRRQLDSLCAVLAAPRPGTDQLEPLRDDDGLRAARQCLAVRPEAGFGLALALGALGEPIDAEMLAGGLDAILARDDPSASGRRRVALLEMATLLRQRREQHRGPFDPRAEEPALCEAMIRALGHPDLRDAPRSLVYSAEMEIDPDGLLIERALDDDDVLSPFWLARMARRDPARALDLIETLIARDGPHRLWLLDGLIPVLERGTPDQRDRATLVALEHLEDLEAEPLELLAIRAAIRDHGTTPAGDALRAWHEAGVFIKPLEAEVLAGIARLDGPGAMEILRPLLERDDSRGAAAGAIGVAFRDTGDVEIVRELMRWADAAKTTRGSAIRGIVWGLLDIGGEEAIAGVDALINRLPARDRVEALWRLAGRTSDRALAELVALGVIDAMPPDASIERAPRDAGRRRPSATVVSALAEAGHAFMFDAESPGPPADYAGAVRHFARKSAGVFTPAAVIDEGLTDDPGGQRRSVAFVHAGRLYRWSYDQGDSWYRMEFIVEAINAALEDEGSPRRLYPIGPGQSGVYAYLPVEPAEAAARRLLLRFGLDAGALSPEAEAEYQDAVRLLRNKGAGGP